MKFLNNNIVVVLFGMSILLASCKRDTPIIQPPKDVYAVLTQENAHNKFTHFFWHLEIVADKEEHPNIWIDFNNNGKKDEGEDAKFGGKHLYSVEKNGKNNVITIYGKIKRLDCGDTDLVDIDISKSDSLKILYCPNNYIKSIGVIPKGLEELYCYNNQIKQIVQLGNVSNLQYLNCSRNQMKVLILENTKLTQMNIILNQFKGADMDNIINRLPDWFDKVKKGEMEASKLYTLYKDDTVEGNVITKEQIKAANKKGWKVFATHSGSNHSEELTAN
ncbi:MAG: leucine-rich repeat domain-containing protein [Porphyromonadaceae bacterium]|nr:leucine-rich repeat domain-containing protein [Porphyromonadaceae bacterium]